MSWASMDSRARRWLWIGRTVSKPLKTTATAVCLIHHTVNTRQMNVHYGNRQISLLDVRTYCQPSGVASRRGSAMSSWHDTLLKTIQHEWWKVLIAREDDCASNISFTPSSGLVIVVHAVQFKSQMSDDRNSGRPSVSRPHQSILDDARASWVFG